MRSLVKPTQILLIASALSLAACGGDNEGSGSLIGNPSSGGGNGGDPANGGGDGTTIEPLLALGVNEGSSFQEGVINVTAPSLSAGQRTSLKFNVVDKNRDNSLHYGTVQLTITSNCASMTNPLATISAPAEVKGGSVTATYEAKGCTGDDTISAQIATGATASATVNIAPTEVGGIQFSRSDHSSISIAGAGTATSPSETKVYFMAVDGDGYPVENIQVTFTLDTDKTDQSQYDPLDRAVLLNTESTTGADGIAYTTLRAGRLNLVATVIASITLNDGSEHFAEADAISINTNMAYDSRFSLSRTPYIVDGWSHDGETVQVTIRGADLAGNPLRDKSTVAFTTNSGSVQPNCSFTEGACTVTWTSHNPRPNDALAYVTARTLGEYSFVDTNQNKLFDDGETIYLDINKNGEYDGDDIEINDAFRGASCSYPARQAGHCKGRAELLEKTPILLVDGPSVEITILSPVVNITGEGSADVCAVLQDQNNNQPPPGTIVTASTSAGSIIESHTPASIRVPQHDLQKAMNPLEYCWRIKGVKAGARGTFSVTASVPEPTNIIHHAEPIDVIIAAETP